MVTVNSLCPHCGSRMLRWANPQGSTWGSDFQYVCFHDECPYYVRGWAWMEGKYNVAASYRYRLDPATGEHGPLPVWSPQALRSDIISTPRRRAPMSGDPVTPEKILKECPRLGLDDRFTFQCNPQLSCFGHCCRDVTIVLTPYDVLRMNRSLGIDSSEFLEQYTLRLQNVDQKFPIVILKMREEESKRCQFLSDQGCGIYRDRPWACRMYPLGLAEPKAATPNDLPFHFVIREDICQGHGEGVSLSVREWIECQGIEEFEMMSVAFKELTLHDFWSNGRALTPQQADMFYMACYDLDRFRRFVFETRFLHLFDIDEARVEALRGDDQELLDFGMQWLRFSIFGERSMRLRPGTSGGSRK